MNTQTMVVLIVEDDENDVYLFRRAIKDLRVSARVEVVSNGKEAVDYLKGEGIYHNRAKYPFPGFLITDLKMPGHTGFELLQWLTDHADCNVIPTIVLTSSNIAQDVQKAYQLAANSYFVKPSQFEELIALFGCIFSYWDKALVPPPPPGGACK